jgi:hypothetical protein
MLQRRKHLGNLTHQTLVSPSLIIVAQYILNEPIPMSMASPESLAQKVGMDLHNNFTSFFTLYSM